MTFALGFIIGCLVGACCLALFACLVIAGRESDREEEQAQREAARNVVFEYDAFVEQSDRKQNIYHIRPVH